MEQHQQLEIELQRQIAFYLKDSFVKIEKVWEQLDEDQIWSRPNEQTLSPANQLLHLTGNMKQWVLAHVAGQPDERNRNAEFAARGGMSKDDVFAAFAKTYEAVVTVLNGPHDFLAEQQIQGHQTTTLGVWIHQCEHLSYHAGQLVFFAKQLLKKEFGFYDDWELG